MTTEELTLNERQLKQLAKIRTLNEAQLLVIQQKTPQSAIKQRKGRGGKMLSYVEHSWVTRVLNEAFQWNWSFEIVEHYLRERVVTGEIEEVYVLGSLTVGSPVEGVSITKQQWGGKEVSRYRSGEKQGRVVSLADDLKAAGSDALKKCASLLGIALDLYSSSMDAEIPATEGTKIAEAIEKLKVVSEETPPDSGQFTHIVETPDPIDEAVEKMDAVVVEAGVMEVEIPQTIMPWKEPDLDPVGAKHTLYAYAITTWGYEDADQIREVLLRHNIDKIDLVTLDSVAELLEKNSP